MTKCSTKWHKLQLVVTAENYKKFLLIPQVFLTLDSLLATIANSDIALNMITMKKLCLSEVQDPS